MSQQIRGFAYLNNLQMPDEGSDLRFAAHGHRALGARAAELILAIDGVRVKDVVRQMHVVVGRPAIVVQPGVDCDLRAFPALQHGMTIDENVRGRSFFAPAIETQPAAKTRRK